MLRLTPVGLSEFYGTLLSCRVMEEEEGKEGRKEGEAADGRRGDKRGKGHNV